jgi:hypothetical protein
MNPSNTVSVTRLIQEIQSELKGQTGSWRKVSELLNQADVEFGFGADEMKQILDQTDISKGLPWPCKTSTWRSFSTMSSGFSRLPPIRSSSCNRDIYIPVGGPLLGG